LSRSGRQPHLYLFNRVERHFIPILKGPYTDRTAGRPIIGPRKEKCMPITIEYCTIWNYYPRAAGLAAEIEKKTGVKPQLIKGTSGVFDVKVDGELVFSKRQAGRFPEPGEITAALESRAVSS